MDRLWQLFVEFVGRFFCRFRCVFSNFSTSFPRFRCVAFRNRSRDPRGVSECQDASLGLAL